MSLSLAWKSALVRGRNFHNAEPFAMLGRAKPVVNGSAGGKELEPRVHRRDRKLTNKLLGDAVAAKNRSIFQSRATRAGGSRVALVEPGVWDTGLEPQTWPW